MNKDFSILHLSDLHFDLNKIDESKLLLGKILEDIKRLEDSDYLNLKLIIFTGDLVKFGQNEDLFNKVEEIFITPLLKEANLNDSDFIYIPGNHELDRTSIDLDFQNGFISRISKDGVERENFKNSNLTNKSKNYFNFIKKYINWDSSDVIFNIYKEIEGKKVGISLYNTSWCSSSYSEQDVKKIQMPVNLAKTTLNEIKNCDYKIALMHHPIDWYEDSNANDIQSVLSEYNLVLCGHKHLECNKQEQKGPLKTLYNYSHKLLPLKNNETGYSIIKISSIEQSLKVFYREYNDKINTFCVGITDIDQEKNKLLYTKYEIGKKDDKISNCYKIYNAINESYIKNLDKLFITNTIENKEKTFDELFVEFALSDYPIYSIAHNKNSQKRKDQVYKITDIGKMNGIINIYGQRESGKTVFSYALGRYFFENFNVYKKIPIVIECKKASISNTNIKRLISQEIFDLCKESFSISKQDIAMLIENNFINVILDEPSFLTKKQKKEIEELNIDNIFNVIEYNPLVFGQDDKGYISNELTDKKTNFYINNYKKHDMKQLIKNINPEEYNTNYAENIISYFYTTALPRTPFVISLIANICANNRYVIPTNQARILEQFLENVLEKINPNEQLSRTYDFNNKEDFLSNFAYKLYKIKKYCLDEDEFYNFILTYHKERGFCIEDSKFDKIFFEKNILVNNNGYVYFRFECFNYYYLAKYAIKHEDFRQEIINIKNLVNCEEILFYYTGLKRDDSELLKNITNLLEDYLKDFSELDSIFDKDPIKTNLGLNKEIVTNVISHEQLNEKEKDDITDYGDKSEKYNPKQDDNVYENKESYERFLSIVGFTIKNSEELKVEEKGKSFDIYLKGCLLLWEQFRKVLLEFAKHLNNKIREKSTDIDNDLNKAYKIFEDILRVCIPIALSQCIMENVATEKMKGVYNEMLEKYDYNTPQKMFLTFLVFDLKLHGYKEKIKNFIKNTTDRNYLMVFLMKLLLAYLYGDLEKNDINEGIIADCSLKALNLPKNKKGSIINDIKKNRFIEKGLFTEK